MASLERRLEMGPKELRWEAYGGGRVALEEHEVHLWQVDMAHELGHLQRLERSLGEDEIARLDRFRYSRDRESFILSHGCLREILGLYTGTAPGEIPIVSDGGGKPRIGGGEGSKGLEFSLSHSRDVALIALGVNRQLGVDVEYIEPDFPVLDVARNSFTGGELELVEAAAGSGRVEAFFRIWTQKEAYLKATGAGLSSPGPEAPFFGKGGAGRPPSISLCHGGRNWTYFDVPPPEGYRIALVVEGRGLKLRLILWRQEGD
jgi:4'-phosphopantetheinyl transferase